MGKVRILISGDYCPIGRNVQLIQNEKYKELFNGFELFKDDVDLGIVNLECPITSSNNKIQKTGPCLKNGNINSLKALNFAGFDLVTLANNHIRDYGDEGIKDTLNNLKLVGIEHVGAGMDSNEAKKTFIKNINGKVVAVVNIAENEFCSAKKSSAGAHTFDLIENIKQIRELRQNVDFLILIYHGGREHYQLPTPELRKIFRFFIENGVDAIVGHHTHCFSGLEYVNGKPIIYSLGNFIFDYKPKYRKGPWTEGYSCILEFDNNQIDVKIIPHYQGRESSSVLELVKDKKQEEFLSRISELNEIIIDDSKFIEHWNTYLKTQTKYYLANFLIANRYLRYIFIKGLIPLVFSKKRLLLLLNLIRCETHNEISRNVIEYLTDDYEK